MGSNTGAAYLTEAVRVLRQYKTMADRAVAQLEPDAIFDVLDDESNSIAVIMQHMAGNMRSRWMDFLTSDGEKPDRNRESEFEDPPATRDALMKLWEDGWNYLFTALEPLSDADMGRTITIRGEAHSVTQAINRQIGHYSYHCGQIVLLAKHFQSDCWKSLTIPRGKSADFNRRVGAGEASQR